MSSETKTYLGDGAYAEFDGYSVKLSTENGVETTNEIYLEPEVWEALKKWVESMTEKARANTSGA